MENKILMRCGHVANSYKLVGDRRIPYCVICDCDKIQTQTFVIEEIRFMKCKECGCVKKSDVNAPFFKSCPNEDYDKFYCGCNGWE